MNDTAEDTGCRGASEGVPEALPLLPPENGDDGLGSDAAAPEGEAPKRPGKRQIVIGSMAALLVVGVVGAGAALGSAYSAPNLPDAPKASANAPTTQASADNTAQSDAELTLAVEAEGTLTKAKVSVYDAKDQEVMGETEVDANTTAFLGKFDKGDYELHVTLAPVAEDGSTYKLPDAPTEFSVDGKGGPVGVEVALEKIAAEDMSKEQLEAASSALAASGKTEAAENAKAAAASAPSVPGSAESVQRPASPSTPNAGGSNAPSTPSGDVGTSTPAPDPAPAPTPEPEPTPTPTPDPVPSDPNAGKTWHEAVYEQRWVPDWQEVTDYSRPVSVYGCSDCGIQFGTGEALLAHGAENGYTHHTYSDVTYPYTISVDNGHHESVLVQAEGWY